MVQGWSLLENRVYSLEKPRNLLIGFTEEDGHEMIIAELVFREKLHIYFKIFIQLYSRDNPVVNYIPSGAMHLRTIGEITQPLNTRQTWWATEMQL